MSWAAEGVLQPKVCYSPSKVTNISSGSGYIGKVRN